MLSLEIGRFGEPQPSRIEGQKNGTMFEMVYASDEPIDFFLAENRWQGLGSFAVRYGLDPPRSRQGDRVEEP